MNSSSRKQRLSLINTEDETDYFSENCFINKSNSFLLINKHNDNLISFVNFSSVCYSIWPKCLECEIELKRYGNLEATVLLKLNTVDGSMFAHQDFKSLNNYEVKFKPGEDSIKIQLLISAQMSSQVGNYFYIHMKIHEKSLNLANLGHISYCMIAVDNEQTQGKLY